MKKQKKRERRTNYKKSEGKKGEKEGGNTGSAKTSLNKRGSGGRLEVRNEDEGRKRIGVSKIEKKIRGKKC